MVQHPVVSSLPEGQEPCLAWYELKIAQLDLLQAANMGLAG